MKDDVAYAVVRVGGQQYKVSAGDSIVVDRVAADEGETDRLGRAGGPHVRAGRTTTPPRSKAKVTAKVDQHVLGEKIKVVHLQAEEHVQEDARLPQPPVAG